MSYKIIILTLAFVAIFAVLALADGGFYGDVTYGGNGCGFVNGDQVEILNTDTGAHDVYTITIQGPAYNTAFGPGPAIWPAGHYHIWVSRYLDSDCGPSVIQIITHGSTDQKVNLIVLGPNGNPNGPIGH